MRSGRRSAETETGPTAPGWWPDPDGGDHLRHWNGRKWGSEHRPMPAWVGGGGGRGAAGGGGGGSGPGGNGDPQPSGPVQPTRRWLVGGTLLMAVAVFAVFVVSLTRGPRIPARSVGDVTFTRRAEAACRRILPELQAERPQLGEKPKDKAELVAQKVDRTATGLEKLVTELRALPVATDDEIRVDRWLDDWDDYIVIGRRYSAALRGGDGDAPRRAATEGDPITRRVYLFSKSNGMPSCVL